MGSTVDELLRHLPAPLHIVCGRVRSPYQHVVIATDFSPASLPALKTAVRWFGDGRLTLFHAFDSPQMAIFIVEIYPAWFKKEK